MMRTYYVLPAFKFTNAFHERSCKSPEWCLDPVCDLTVQLAHFFGLFIDAQF